MYSITLTSQTSATNLSFMPMIQTGAYIKQVLRFAV